MKFRNQQNLHLQNLLNIPMLTNTSLLELWEYGHAATPFEYGNLLLMLDDARNDEDDILDLTLGERDRYLLDLRKRLFGSKINAESHCKECSEKQDMSFTIQDIMVKNYHVKNEYDMLTEELSIKLRPVKLRDLSLVSSKQKHETAEDMLLELCILSAKKNGNKIPVTSMSQQEKANIVSEMSEIDPQSEIIINSKCPSCGVVCNFVFDICAYLRTEIDAYVRQLLLDVHYLSASYGWSESDVLAMSDHRRRMYINMIIA